MSDVAVETNIQLEKELAAAKSLEFVHDGMCLGLGSGTTAAVMLELLGQRIRGGLKVHGVPTSEVSRRLAEQAGIPLIGLDRVRTIDLTIDGADEADGQLNLIKGGGGALLREKVVASLSRRVIIIADARKRVDRLGSFPLPVEVVQFAWQPIAARLIELGASVTLRGGAGQAPFLTDEGNFILDCAFGQIDDPPALAHQLDTMPGVMEHGLFIGIADTLILGQGTQTLVMDRARS